MNLFFIVFLFFLFCFFLLSIGYIFAGKKIKGSCGGIAVYGPDGENISCDTCPNREKNLDCPNKKKSLEKEGD